MTIGFIGTNGRRVRKYNQALVLDLVRRRGPLSRVAIAEHLDLEFQTVSTICSRLIDDGLLMDSGTVAGARRRSRAVAVRPTAVWSVGVEINREHANLVLITLDGAIHGRHQYPVQSRDPVAVLDDVAEGARSVIDDLDVTPDVLAGIGVSVPGPVDLRDGRVLAPPTFSSWQDVNVRDEFSSRLELPVWMQSTASGAALGEQWHGAGRETDDFTYVYFGTGVGLGVVSGRRLVRGAQGNAGEFGHVQVDPTGPLCSCGSRGCLVQYAAPQNISHLLDTAHRERRQAGFEDVPPHDVRAAFEPGAPGWVRSVVEDALAQTARTVATIASVLDSHDLVLGGPAMDVFGEAMLRHTKEAVMSACKFGRTAPSVVASTVGADAGPVGAASLPLQAIYSPIEA